MRWVLGLFLLTVMAFSYTINDISIYSLDQQDMKIAINVSSSGYETLPVRVYLYSPNFGFDLKDLLVSKTLYLGDGEFSEIIDVGSVTACKGAYSLLVETPNDSYKLPVVLDGDRCSVVFLKNRVLIDGFTPSVHVYGMEGNRLFDDVLSSNSTVDFSSIYRVDVGTLTYLNTNFTHRELMDKPWVWIKSVGDDVEITVKFPGEFRVFNGEELLASGKDYLQVNLPVESFPLTLRVSSKFVSYEFNLNLDDFNIHSKPELKYSLLKNHSMKFEFYNDLGIPMYYDGLVVIHGANFTTSRELKFSGSTVFDYGFLPSGEYTLEIEGLKIHVNVERSIPAQVSTPSQGSDSLDYDSLLIVGVLFVIISVAITILVWRKNLL